MMMVEAFDTWRTPKRQYDYGRFFDANSDSDIARDGQRRQELAGRRAVVDRQRDPRLDLGHGRPADRQAPGRRHQGDRHHAPDRHRLGQVPQRPGHRLGRRPDPRPARRPRAELQHRRLGRRAARQVPEHVPLRVRVLLGDVDARRLPGPRPAQHRRELHAGQARDVLLRQQPRLVDDERRVRPEEGPRPQVLPGRVPVVGHRLHRRADAVQRVPGQVVVLRRGRHRGLPQGRLLALPQPVDEGPDGPPAADELDRPRARRAGPGVGLRQRRHRRAVPQRPLARRPALRPQDDGRRPARTSRRPRRRATTRPSPRARTRAATRAPTAAPASCT